jgi:replicative DNA helicase
MYDTPIKKLIEDNIEIETRSMIENINSESGLDYASNLNDGISKIILQHTSKINNHKSTDQVIKELLTEIKNGQPSDEYIKTGIESLDKHIIGIPKKHLTIIGARPSQGKTTFAMQLKRNFISQGLQVGMFSLEMDSKDLLLKDISADTNIDSIDIENGKLSDIEHRKICEAKFETDNLLLMTQHFKLLKRLRQLLIDGRFKRTLM